jgi:hypothetical protein
MRDYVVHDHPAVHPLRAVPACPPAEQGERGRIDHLRGRATADRRRIADGRPPRDGPSGRRAALAYGPDVWEIIKLLREIDERGAAALEAAADVVELDASRVTAAMTCYAEYRDEIDAEIANADEAWVGAEEAWRVQRQLIA